MATQQDVAERIEADFVVVGAGSAGCAVAARLSEDPATKVLLLEAGGEDKNRWIHIPLGFGKTFADPSVNWCYETEPDPGRRVFAQPCGYRAAGGACADHDEVRLGPFRQIQLRRHLVSLPSVRFGRRYFSSQDHDRVAN